MSAENAAPSQELRSKAIWNPNATANWSVLFTPAFGSYLQMLNWRALDEPKRAEGSKRWFYASIAMLAAYVLIALFADESSSDGSAKVFGFFFLVAWYGISGRAQSEFVKSRYGTAYPRQPWGKTLLWAVGALFGYVIISVLIGLIVGAARGT